MKNHPAMNQVHRSFHTADYVIFSFVLVISAVIGVYHACTGGKQRTNKEFFMANRSLPVIPVAISILVTLTSAVLILGVTAEVYTRGTMYFMAFFGISFACVVSTVTFVPLLYPLKYTSSYEYLKHRFDSHTTKLVGSCIFILSQLLYMGIVLFSPATALEAVTGFPEWATIIITGLFATFYTAIGGMKAVIWTDVFQSLIMVAGLMSIVIMGCVDVGGIGKVWDIANGNNRIQFFEFNPDPTVRHSTWNLIFGSFVTWLYVFGVNQAVCQRFNSVPTLKAARISILLNIPGTLLLLGLTCLAGLVIFAYYANKGCDPIGAGYITNPNQLLPYFVMDVLGVPGLPGLFVACLFSGSLSTLSSSLSAISANTWEDVLKLKFDHWPEYKKTIVTKCTVVVFGVLSIGMAYLAAGLGGTVVQASMSFSGSAGGALLGIFILGAVFPWSNWIGAVAGGIIGVMFSMWISIGAYVSGRGRPGMLPTTVQHCPYNTTFNATYVQLNLTIPTIPLPPPPEGLNSLYSLSYLWFPGVGFLTTITVGMIASAITGFNNPSDMDPRYHMPIFDWMCGCLIPVKIKRFLNCKVDRSVLQYDNEQISDQKQQAHLNESPGKGKGKEDALPLYDTNRTTQVTSDVDTNGHEIVLNTKL